MGDKRSPFWQEVALVLLAYGLLFGYLASRDESSWARRKVGELRDGWRERKAFAESVTDTLDELPVQEETS